MQSVLNLIKKFIPKKIFTALQPSYHYVMGCIAALWYGNPSDKLIVVGVTGTTGKTTTVYMLAEVLKSAGVKTGYISTALFGDGKNEWLNDKKMTMLGRFFTQRMLKKMNLNGCKVAIIETSSQGILQYRHRFINYDVAVFTGLHPEHIEAHGGFENYKQAKGKLFEHLNKCAVKTIDGKRITKTSVLNADDEHMAYFADFKVERQITFGIVKGDLQAKNIKTSGNGTSFEVEGNEINMQILGKFNVQNALAAAAVAKTLDIEWPEIKKGIESINGILGRLEKIAGPHFNVIVDYAFEPNAMNKLYETINSFEHGKIIHVLGGTGGGRDKARRPKLGAIADKEADFVIITDEDPYDEDPKQIIEDVATGIKNKIENQNLWKIIDRREAISKALSLAKENDIVLVTGKGSEQAMCVAGGKMIPWDDRQVVREELAKL